MKAIVFVAALWSVGTAWADEVTPVRLSGTITDTVTGNPIPGALVYVTGTTGSGMEKSLATDELGRYALPVKPGTYYLVFVHGGARSGAKVVVQDGQEARLDGKLDAGAGETIIIEEHVAPPVLPKPINYKPLKAPPYSDAAILSNAWTKAWLLLDVSEKGEVERIKFLKHPGYDLENIARSEAFKLKFSPGRDKNGKPVRTWILWNIEWPSAWWLSQFVGTRSSMPPVVGFPPRRLDAHVPCAGSGPWHLGSVMPVYKDCSKPDLKKAATEPWVSR